MSVRVAWEFLSDTVPDHYGSDQAYRWRTRRKQLLQDPEPERLLQSWVASRADRCWFRTRNNEGLLDDQRLIPSGISDSRSGISSTIIEAYVLQEDSDSVQRMYLLHPGNPQDNVLLHITSTLPPNPVSTLLVAADLTDHDNDRELSRARTLIKEALP